MSELVGNLRQRRIARERAKEVTEVTRQWLLECLDSSEMRSEVTRAISDAYDIYKDGSSALTACADAALAVVKQRLFGTSEKIDKLDNMPGAMS